MDGVYDYYTGAAASAASNSAELDRDPYAGAYVATARPLPRPAVDTMESAAPKQTEKKNDPKKV